MTVKQLRGPETMNDVDFLAEVSIFSHMKKRDLKRIAKLAKHEVFDEGDVIIKEGDRDGRLFVIIRGEAEVVKNLGRKNRLNQRTMDPKSYFGEMALIDDLVRTASVVAKKETEVLTLNQLNLRQEMGKYPAIAVELLQMLSRRIRALEKNMSRALGAFLPICANCNKIRDENGIWVSIERYITDHADTQFSHSICEECKEILYPELTEGH
jgi:CRP-like cAMP-binding protein